MYKFLYVFAIFAVISIHQVKAENCSSEKCERLCGTAGLKGQCAGDECRCVDQEKKCSLTEKLPCAAACASLKLSGECHDDGQCSCKAKVGPCFSFKNGLSGGFSLARGLLGDCQQSCKNDPENAMCLIVHAAACVRYGPAQMCLCHCYVL